MSQTEDIPYAVSEFATPDKPKEETDDDQPNKSVLLEVRQYLDEAIVEHNSLDVIDLTEGAKLTPGQQIAVSKQVVHHLRSVKSVVDNKIKELK
jgi:hypothetical protein